MTEIRDGQALQRSLSLSAPWVAGVDRLRSVKTLLDRRGRDRTHSVADPLALAVTLGMIWLLALLTFTLAAGVGLTVLATATWHWW